MSVNWVTAQGSAKSPSDYIGTGGKLIITAYHTSAGITVFVRGDKIEEPNEVFYVLLFNPVNTDLKNVVAIGGIINDD